MRSGFCPIRPPYHVCGAHTGRGTQQQDACVLYPDHICPAQMCSMGWRNQWRRFPHLEAIVLHQTHDASPRATGEAWSTSISSLMGRNRLCASGGRLDAGQLCGCHRCRTPSTPNRFGQGCCPRPSSRDSACTASNGLADTAATLREGAVQVGTRSRPHRGNIIG